MRAQAPNGGTPDHVLDLREAGYCSTTELSARIGAGTLSGTWISNELGIKPAVSVRSGAAFYWAPEQVAAIRKALVMKLLKAQFEAAP